MLGFGPLEIAVLATLVVMVFGWQALPRLFKVLKRWQLMRGDLKGQLKRLLRYL